MKKLLLVFLLLLSAGLNNAQSLYFPPNIGTTWDTLSPVSLGWCPDKIDTLLDYLDQKNSKAFILLKDGKIVIEHYFGSFTQDSLWYWASAGKTLTAFMVGIAKQENFLSLDDTTSSYLGAGWTNCTIAEEEKITIRNQLSMTSGLDDGVPDHYCTLDTCLNCIAAPGTRWAYHNGPYTLLDGVIEAATGQNLNVYTTQKLKTPTGMTGSFFQSGYNNVFFSKPRSMARFGLLLLNRGNWNGNQLLTDTAYFNEMTNSSQALNPSYGYLTWLNGKSTYMVPGLQLSLPGPLSPNAPNDMYAALGKNGQTINVWPSENIVWIRMGNAPDGLDVPFLLNDSIWKRLNDVFCGATSTATAIEDALDLRLAPNPAHGTCVVSSGGAPFDLLVHDALGRLVLRQYGCAGNATIDVEGLPAGTYFVRALMVDGRWRLKRLMVAH